MPRRRRGEAAEGGDGEPATAAPTGGGGDAGVKDELEAAMEAAAEAARPGGALDAAGIVAKASKAARASKGQKITDVVSEIVGLGVAVRYSTRRRELQVAWDRIPREGRVDRGEGFVPADEEIALWVMKGLAELGIARSKPQIVDALALMGDEQRRDEVAVYLEACAEGWDGHPRCDALFRDYFGCEGDGWVEQVSRIFCMAAAARALDPGVIFNSVPILEGEQQIGKTSGIRALGGQWYSAFDMALHHARAREEVVKRGGWIYEVEEMGSVRKSDAEAVKAFVSSTSDQYMGKYQRHVTTAPRNFVLIGTTNNVEYLPDVTGNARFWPLPCRGVRVGDLLRERDQIWGEAVVLWRRAKEAAGGDSVVASLAALALGGPEKELLAMIVAERVSLSALEVAARELMEGIGLLHLPTLVLGPLKDRGLLGAGVSNPWLMSRLAAIAREMGFSHIVRQYRDGELRRKVKVWVSSEWVERASTEPPRDVLRQAKLQTNPVRWREDREFRE